MSSSMGKCKYFQAGWHFREGQEEVHGILIQVLPVVVVAHHSLRIAMATHHLNLPVGQPQIQSLRDGRPP